VPSNVTPFFPINATAFLNDGMGNTGSSAISAFIAGSTGTADDAQIGLFMTLNQTFGGYAYEQLNYVVDFNVSSLVNTTGTAGTLPGLVSRTYTVSGNVGGTTGFVAFGGEMNFWDGTTNTLLGPSLLFNYFNNSPGAFTATVSASSFINAVNFPDVLRITGDFFLIGDPSTITVTSVPEPSTMILGAVGMAGIGILGIGRRLRSRC
ncbi:PEP-CTERM sorting domain-containing protein, partial [bacterium]|nr:PEP-CTERM sorting domain-containing protein [bacterium]